MDLTQIKYLGDEGIKQIGKAIPKIWSGTKAEWEQFDKSTLADGTIVNITDDYNENPIQVKVMPTNASEGDVVQYIGATDSDYTNGYFYKNVTDETGILSWKNIPVMRVETPENKEVLDKFSENDEGKVLYDNKPLASDNLWTGTKAEYDAIVDKDPNKTYIVTDEESTLADYILDDTTTSTDKTWSSEKINNSFIHNLSTLETGWLPTSLGVEKTATKNGFLAVSFRVTSTIRISILDNGVIVWSGDCAGQAADNIYINGFIPIINGHKYSYETSDASKIDTVQFYTNILYS